MHSLLPARAQLILASTQDLPPPEGRVEKKGTRLLRQEIPQVRVTKGLLVSDDYKRNNPTTATSGTNRVALASKGSLSQGPISPRHQACM